MGESKKTDFTYAGNQDKGLQAFSQIFAMKDRQIVKWQRIAYTGMACVALSVLCITYIGTKSTFIPYVIHVDEETGYVQSLGALTQKNVEPTDAEISYFLSRFVENMRSIPMDKKVVQSNINRAVKFMTPEAASKYKKLYLDSFTGEIGNTISRVTVLSCLPVSGQKNVYTVRWKETKTSGASPNPTDYYYSGNFTIENKPITKKEELALNPIGLFISDFHYAEEQEGGKK